jgi:hypothetical protein
VQRLFVIDRNLFAGCDVSQGAKENVVMQDLHERIRTARVIDVVSAVPTAAAVQTPASINLTDSEHPSMRTASRFGVRDLFAGILGDLVSLFERDSREAAFTVNRRRLDC